MKHVEMMSLRVATESAFKRFGYVTETTTVKITRTNSTVPTSHVQSPNSRASKTILA